MADYLIVQLRINRDKEPDVVPWIEGQENKTQAILDLIRAHIGGQPAHEGTAASSPGPAAALDLDAIRGVFDDALDTHAGHLRKVFDALLDQKLADLTVGAGQAGTADETMDAKIDAMF